MSRETRRVLVCAWMTAALVFVFIGPAVAAPPPASAFGATPDMTAFALSPDGKALAWAEARDGGTSVVVYDIASARDVRKFPVPEYSKLRSLVWADGDTLLIQLSLTRTLIFTRRYSHEWFRTIAADVPTGKLHMLLQDSNDREWVTGSYLLSTRAAGGGAVTMSTWDFADAAYRMQTGSRIAGGRRIEGWSHSVFSVDTSTGKGAVIARGTPYTYEWIVDAQGTPVARSEWEAERKLFTILAKEGMGWRTIYRKETETPVWVLGTSGDARAVLVIDAQGSPHLKLLAVPLDGSAASVLAERTGRDVSAVMVDVLTGIPAAVRFGYAAEDIHWLDDKYRAKHRSLQKAFPGRDIEIAGRSEDFERVLVDVSDPSHPPMQYLVDFAAGKADIVGETYPRLKDVALGEVRTIDYRARDGATIPAFLTLPPDLKPERLPLVVLPHGGPEAEDEHGFDWWAQFLASRGYVVLQPQFRGSTGRGEAHRLAGYRQWGRLMQDDVSDGVKAMIEQGVADEKRVCIVGASYGGYAALAGAAFTPDLYACAASVNGVSDLPLMLRWVESNHGEETDALYYWRDHIGMALDERVISRSPARFAAEVKMPVLLIHGVDDTVVPIAQSERMHAALKAAGKPVEFVKLNGEDHWLSRSGTRVRMLEELERFLAANIGKPAS